MKQINLIEELNNIECTSSIMKTCINKLIRKEQDRLNVIHFLDSLPRKYKVTYSKKNNDFKVRWFNGYRQPCYATGSTTIATSSKVINLLKEKIVLGADLEE